MEKNNGLVIKISKKARALVLSGQGINCERETKHALDLAGADVDIIHLSDLKKGNVMLENYHILVFPGGFSYGDNIASGKVLANDFKYSLSEQLDEFVNAGKLVLGICNGFQVMVKLGLLPGLNGMKQEATVTYNDSGRFEDRWVYLKLNPTKCVFTKDMESIYLPVRHGEGKFIAEPEILEELKKNKMIVAQYIDLEGKLAGYPWNPNGSINNIAGICSKSGKIFGLMPHPEGYTHKTNHPHWTRLNLPEKGAGLKIFENSVKYINSNLL